MCIENCNCVCCVWVGNWGCQIGGGTGVEGAEGDVGNRVLREIL